MSLSPHFRERWFLEGCDLPVTWAQVSRLLFCAAPELFRSSCSLRLSPAVIRGLVTPDLGLGAEASFSPLGIVASALSASRHRAALRLPEAPVSWHSGLCRFSPGFMPHSQLCAGSIALQAGLLVLVVTVHSATLALLSRVLAHRTLLLAGPDVSSRARRRLPSPISTDRAQTGSRFRP